MDDNQSQDQQRQDQPTTNPHLDEPVQPLPQDYGTPAAGPTDVDDDVPTDAPATDSNVQAEEVYDEGEAGVVEDGQAEENNPT